jgi:capsid protein
MTAIGWKSSLELELASKDAMIKELQSQLPAEEAAHKSQPKMFLGDGGGYYSNTGYVPVFSQTFNGEKTPGELGSPRNLLMDYRALRARSYEAYGKSNILKIVAGRVFQWVIGSGLKMQAQPDKDILKFEKITADVKGFTKNTEAYFSQWAESNRSDYNGMANLHINAQKNLETEFLGGDSLVICRLDEKFNLTVQVVDGQHVQSPVASSALFTGIQERGNIIIRGIEMTPKGDHVAYYVQKTIDNISTLEWERIEAYGEKSGCLMAWMTYGDKHRIDHHRGIPQITAILDTIVKLERYTEATVAKVEEIAKTIYQIVHDQHSDGENPLIGNVKRNIIPETNATMMPWDLATITGKQIAATEDRMIHNMPIGSQLKTVSSQVEIDFEPFWKAIFIQISASMGVPPEVALQQYNSNYSASRAAINMWGYIIDIKRKKKQRDFYQPIYNIWLYVHILKNKVQADGYLEAKMNGNDDVIEAYSKAKFTGVNMPHIDPKKEADAIRVMLGLGDQSPLITREDATEQLGNGDWDANLSKIEDENNALKTAGYIPIPLPPVTPTNSAVKV